MKSFAELERRLKSLLPDLDGQFWQDILSQLNPPDQKPEALVVHELAFRDAKALAGYVPDLLHLIKNNSPHTLSASEHEALTNILGLFNLAARIPVLLVMLPDYQDVPGLTELFNGYRQTLLEISDFLAQSEGRNS